jgi:hypothetical protein
MVAASETKKSVRTSQRLPVRMERSVKRIKIKMIVSNKTSSSTAREGCRTVQVQDYAPNADTPFFLMVQAIQHTLEK